LNSFKFEEREYITSMGAANVFGYSVTMALDQEKYI
jgi:hypothetical protein